MFEKIAESKNESSNRRRFFRKILGLGVAAGAASLLLNRDKALLPLAQAGSGSGETVNIDVWNYGGDSTTIESNVNSCAFRGKNTYPGGSAVDGWASAGSGVTKGVFGLSESISGIGVCGGASASTGENYGVYGQSDSVSGRGVYGKATASTGENYGVYGESLSEGGGCAGVYGLASASTGVIYGVHGKSMSGYGTGVCGTATSGAATGVSGTGSTGPSGYGVWGYGHTGVHGIGAAYTGGIGVCGIANGYYNIPIVAIGQYSQESNLQQWQLGSLIASVVNKNGYLGIGTSSPLTPVHVKSSSSNPAVRLENENDFVGQFIYCFSSGTHIPFFSGRRARGTITSPSAVQTDDTLMRYGGSGYGISGFPGGNRAILEFKAAQTWTDSNQGTYITFSTTPNNSSTAAERMRITDAGEIVPPTDNTGSIGTASKRWSLVRATTVTSGDLAFENSFRVTEDGESKLAFTNPKGEKIAVLDSEGNLRVKGKVIEGL